MVMSWCSGHDMRNMLFAEKFVKYLYLEGRFSSLRSDRLLEWISELKVMIESQVLADTHVD